MTIKDFLWLLPKAKISVKLCETRDMAENPGCILYAREMSGRETLRGEREWLHPHICRFECRNFWAFCVTLFTILFTKHFLCSRKFIIYNLGFVTHNLFKWDPFLWTSYRFMYLVIVCCVGYRFIIVNIPANKSGLC